MSHFDQVKMQGSDDAFFLNFRTLKESQGNKMIICILICCWGTIEKLMFRSQLTA